MDSVLIFLGWNEQVGAIMLKVRLVNGSITSKGYNTFAILSSSNTIVWGCMFKIFCDSFFVLVPSLSSNLSRLAGFAQKVSSIWPAEQWRLYATGLLVLLCAAMNTRYIIYDIMYSDCTCVFLYILIFYRMLKNAGHRFCIHFLRVWKHRIIGKFAAVKYLVCGYIHL